MNAMNTHYPFRVDSYFLLATQGHGYQLQDEGSGEPLMPITRRESSLRWFCRMVLVPRPMQHSKLTDWSPRNSWLSQAHKFRDVSNCTKWPRIHPSDILDLRQDVAAVPKFPFIHYSLRGSTDTQNTRKGSDLRLHWLPSFDPAGFLARRIDSEAPVGIAKSGWIQCMNAQI